MLKVYEKMKKRIYVAICCLILISLARYVNCTNLSFKVNVKSRDKQTGAGEGTSQDVPQPASSQLDAPKSRAAMKDVEMKQFKSHRMLSLSIRVFNALKTFMKFCWLNLYGPVIITYQILAAEPFPQCLLTLILTLLQFVINQSLVTVLGPMIELLATEQVVPDLDEEYKKIEARSNNMFLYKILGLPFSVTQQSIKKRYQELYSRVHPKNNDSPDAAVQLRIIQAAYDVLSVPTKRSMYDRTGDIPRAIKEYENKYEYVHDESGPLIRRKAESKGQGEKKYAEGKQPKELGCCSIANNMLNGAINVLRSSEMLHLYRHIMPEDEILCSYVGDLSIDNIDISFENQSIILLAKRLRDKLKNNDKLTIPVNAINKSPFTAMLLEALGNVYQREASNFLGKPNFKIMLRDELFDLKLFQRFPYIFLPFSAYTNKGMYQTERDPMLCAKTLSIKERIRKAVRLALNDPKASPEECKRRATILGAFGEEILNKMSDAL